MKRQCPALLLVAAGLTLILVGVAQGQPQQVLAKAIRVCMECVGIG